MDPNHLRAFTTANAAAFVIALPVVLAVFRRKLVPDSDETIHAGDAAVRSAYILLFVILEASAFFGVLVCYWTTASGSAPAWAWLNMVPGGVFVASAALLYPSRGKVVKLLTTTTWQAALFGRATEPFPVRLLNAPYSAPPPAPKRALVAKNPETLRCMECDEEIPPGDSRCPCCGWSYETGSNP